MSTGRNKHDIRAFCPPTLAQINSLELERCPAAPVVPGLDSSKGSSKNNLSLGSCPADRTGPAMPASPGCAGSGTVFLQHNQNDCFVNSCAYLVGSQGPDMYQTQSVRCFLLNSGNFSSPSITAEASRPCLHPTCEHTPL